MRVVREPTVSVPGIAQYGIGIRYTSTGHRIRCCASTGHRAGRYHDTLGQYRTRHSTRVGR
eukprot:2071582-Rhodomonas_salina.1